MNGAWSLTHIWSYMLDATVNHVQAHSAAIFNTLPMTSWFVASLREACGHVDAAFWWPSDRIYFQLAVKTAIHEPTPRGPSSPYRFGALDRITWARALLLG